MSQQPALDKVRELVDWDTVTPDTLGDYTLDKVQTLAMIAVAEELRALREQQEEKDE